MLIQEQLERKGIPPRPVQQLPPGVSAEDYMALHHEVTEQFPNEPTAPPHEVQPRPRQQLPPGVTAEDMEARRGEQP